MITGALTFAHVINWVTMIVNFLFMAVSALMIYIYNQDKQSNKEQFEALRKQVKENEVTGRQELKDSVESLERRFDSKLSEILERVEGKLDDISQDTKKISEIEQKVAAAMVDIGWLKQNDK